jgi:GMP synthase-like glutamine amidotransferase
MRFHCLQHIAFESPGSLIDSIREQGDELSFTRLYQGDPLPLLDAFDALIILGGPMSIHEEDEFPWLRQEKELIRAAIRRQKKILGICLGAQLIAAVLGARIYPNPHKEIGFWPVYWTKDAGNRLLHEPNPGYLRPGGTSLFFHWHGETFDLPEGAVRLAWSEACRNQAFLLGDRILGIQFHPEATPEIIRDMIRYEGHELVEGPFIQTADSILRQLPGSEDGKQWLHTLFTPFFYEQQLL